MTAQSNTSALALLALGIVFGDIGTSPLYALKETFNPAYNIPLTFDNILGGCSCIFWALMLVVMLKYITFILRATNKGEGGIMAMLALVSASLRGKPKTRKIMLAVALCGAALFFGDSVLTPAISVVSAVEGLVIGSSIFDACAVPFAVAIMLVLFYFQHRGTAFMGRFFGPICLVWFGSIAVVGLWNIIHFPQILWALNPFYAIRFLATHGVSSLWVLSSVLLAFTGAEALYADVGHFGQKAIRMAWFFVFPALILNYLGQGALLMHSPNSLTNPFYLACPAWSLYPMVFIATLATIIASQAVISGTYSIASQAMLLRYFPRMKIVHTSSAEMGQIYIPVVNWILFIAVTLTLINFKSSENLASAYGIAVAGTMLTTTLLAFSVVRYDWKYPLWLTLLLISVFFIVDIVFFSASLLKIFDGGWYPLTIALLMLILMQTWRKGREIVTARREENPEDLLGFLKTLLKDKTVKRVDGVAVFFCQFPNNVPHAFAHNVKHNKVLHKHVLFLNLLEEDVPIVNEKNRVQMKKIHDGCYHLSMSFGFKEERNIIKALNLCLKEGYDFLEEEASFFLSNENLLLSRRTRNMLPMRKRVFIFLVRNQRSIAEYFYLPSDRVIQLGTQIEI